MYFISIGLLLQGSAETPAGVDTSHLNLLGFAQNLVPVTLGNIVGGALMVALFYHTVYRRGAEGTTAEQLAQAASLRAQPVRVRN